MNTGQSTASMPRNTSSANLVKDSNSPQQNLLYSNLMATNDEDYDSFDSDDHSDEDVKKVCKLLII